MDVQYAEEVELTLYHGTCAWTQIRKEGLPAGSCLAQNSELAWAYAESADGEEPVVLAVVVNSEDLDVDWPSISEPVGFGDRTSKEMEEEVEEHTGALTWQDALRLVGAVRILTHIPASSIQLHDG